MTTMNQIMLIGWVGDQPVIQAFEREQIKVTFRVGTKNAEGIDTDWHNISSIHPASQTQLYARFAKGTHLLLIGRVSYGVLTTGYHCRIQIQQAFELDYAE